MESLSISQNVNNFIEHEIKRNEKLYMSFVDPKDQLELVLIDLKHMLIFSLLLLQEECPIGFKLMNERLQIKGET